MNGSSGVSGSRERLYNNEEVDAMRRDESTSAIVNKARRDAGYKEPDVAVRGDDKTLSGVLADRKTHVGKAEAIGGAIHAAEVAEAVGVAAKAGHAAGRAPLVVLPIATLVAAHYGMIEMEHDKAAMKDGATRDQLRAAVLFELDVPAGFKAAEMGKLGVTVTNQNTAGKISGQFKYTDKPLVATLQLHCDRGMHASRRMVESGLSKDAFLKANPEVARKYGEDTAFHNGFDALEWAKKDSPATYKAEIGKLEARDARYEALHITYRM